MGQSNDASKGRGVWKEEKVSDDSPAGGAACAEHKRDIICLVICGGDGHEEVDVMYRVGGGKRRTRIKESGESFLRINWGTRCISLTSGT